MVNTPSTGACHARGKLPSAVGSVQSEEQSSVCLSLMNAFSCLGAPEKLTYCQEDVCLEMYKSILALVEHLTVSAVKTGY